MSDELEDDEDEVDEENDIEALVNKLPLEMRRKILSKNAPISEDEESEDEEEDEDEKNRWGKKKNYWNADTADVEDVEDLDDAREEEAATKELFQAKLKRMQQKDFYDDLDNEEEDNSDDVDADSQNGNTLGAKLQQTKQAQSKSKKSKQSIDFLVCCYEKVFRDILLSAFLFFSCLGLFLFIGNRMLHLFIFSFFLFVLG